MVEATSSDLLIREPIASERMRALSLFRHLAPPSEAWLLAAVRTKPVERFIAAGALWQNGNIGRFRVTSRPGVALETVLRPLTLEIEEMVRIAGGRILEYADLLADENDLCRQLLELNFSVWRTERFFEVSTIQAYERVMKLTEVYADRIPKTWRIESIRRHPPETVMELIEQYRLLPLAELRENWRADAARGFDLDLSSILFEGTRPIGTLLWRRSAEAYIVDVRVVVHENPRLRALGNLCLFRHACQNGDPRGPIRCMQFRGGESEHRETANLALRMGGHELPPRRVLRKQL
jgi:hypothetical protein